VGSGSEQVGDGGAEVVGRGCLAHGAGGALLLQDCRDHGLVEHGVHRHGQQRQVVRESLHGGAVATVPDHEGHLRHDLVVGQVTM
jgi:hypothetical protein